MGVTAPNKAVLPATITNIEQLTSLEAKSREEKAAVIETDLEFKRRGFFKRIFPSYDFLYYK